MYGYDFPHRQRRDFTSALSCVAKDIKTGIFQNTES